MPQFAWVAIENMGVAHSSVCGASFSVASLLSHVFDHAKSWGAANWACEHLTKNRYRITSDIPIVSSSGVVWFDVVKVAWIDEAVSNVLPGPWEKEEEAA